MGERVGMGRKRVDGWRRPEYSRASTGPQADGEHDGEHEGARVCRLGGMEGWWWRSRGREKKRLRE